MDIITVEEIDYKIVGFGLGTDPLVFVERADYFSDNCS